MVVCFSVYVLEHTGMGVPHFLCHGKTGSIPHNPELDKWGEKNRWMDGYTKTQPLYFSNDWHSAKSSTN